MMLKNRTLLLLLLVFSMESNAHPGRTDAYGCHTCKTNCPKWGLTYGEYHCHKAKGLPQPQVPIKSHLNKDGGDGHTESAPEYEIGLLSDGLS